MDWLSASEIVAGLVIKGSLSSDLINPRDVMPPLDKVITTYQKAVPDDDSQIIMEIGIQPYTAAINAADAITQSKTDIAQYIPLLESLATSAEVGVSLELTAHKLKRGEPIDIAKIKAELAPLETGARNFMKMSKITPTKAVWKPMFFADKWLGGLIDGGLQIIAAPPATGKTSIMLRLAARQAKMGKQVAIFSLEMPASLIVYRIKQIAPDITLDQLDNIIITDGLYDYLEVYATIGQLAMQFPDLYAIYIDFADMMIPPQEEESAGLAGKIYRTMAFAAKRTGLPVVLLSQLSGGYIGGIPKVHHIRYTRLAEAMAVTIWLLYNPNQLFADMGAKNSNNEIRPEPGKAWIIFGKSRYGYPMSQLGALKLDWLDNGVGWQDHNPMWKSLTNV